MLSIGLYKIEAAKPLDCTAALTCHGWISAFTEQHPIQYDV